MFEVEVKVVLMAPGALRDRLRRLEAKPGTVVRQTDRYLRHPARDLVQTDEAVRVRQEEREGTVVWMLTHKGPRGGGVVGARQEHEVGVDQDPGSFLAALGFEVAATVCKQRETWRFRDLVVALDEVEGAGWFAEVESVISEQGQVESATHAVEAAVRELGLGGAKRVQASYLELVLASTE